MHPEEQHPTSKHRAFKQTGTTNIFSFRYQSCTWKRSGSSFRKKNRSGCNSGINLVVVLQYTSFNFIQTPNKSLRFRKFRRRNVHHGQSCTAFFGWCALSKVSTFLFLQLFVPNNSAFAQPIFVEHTCCSNVVNSKVGKQKEACDIIIHNSWR